MSRAIRRAIESAVLCLVTVIVWRTWYLEGLPVPLCVDSGSMAPTLLGPHRDIVCGDCGFPFVCGCNRQGSDSRAACPNCGYSGNDVRNWPALPGDRVLVHRTMFQLRQPRRWEVVAFRTPGRESQLSTKRVVAFPGESVDIRDGDVYVNGTLARKTLEQQRATSILVHDARYVPYRRTHAPPRWRPDAGESGWSRQDGRYVYSAKPEKQPGQPIDWLSYRHWRRVPGQPDRVAEGPVVTESAYNQGHRVPAQSVRPTSDLRLSFRWVRTSGPGWLWVRATDGQEVFLVKIASSEHRFEAFHNGRPIIGSYPGKSRPDRRPVQVDVSLVDQQFLAALDGCTVIALPFERSQHDRQPSANPFALGVTDAEIELDRLRVFRDVYYDIPVGQSAERKSASDSANGVPGFFLLGDNAPFSEDSRSWSKDSALNEDALVGKPFFVFLPTRGVQVQGRWFRIPDHAAIRYIR